MRGSVSGAGAVASKKERKSLFGAAGTKGEGSGGAGRGHALVLQRLLSVPLPRSVAGSSLPASKSAPAGSRMATGAGGKTEGAGATFEAEMSEDELLVCRLPPFLSRPLSLPSSLPASFMDAGGTA